MALGGVKSPQSWGGSDRTKFYHPPLPSAGGRRPPIIPPSRKGRWWSPSRFPCFLQGFLSILAKKGFPNYQKVAKRSRHSSKINILLFSSLRLCLPMPSYALFFLFAALLSLFKIEQNARDIRQKRSPWPRLVRKTPNLSKTLCFHSKNWPPGSKT